MENKQRQKLSNVWEHSTETNKKLDTDCRALSAPHLKQLWSCNTNSRYV